MPTVFGQLGLYRVDSRGDPPSYGLYIELNGRPVFVDIREDKLFEDRKNRALELFRNTARLEVSFQAFLHGNPAYETKQIMCIGLHAKDLKRGEVFWEPDGYTLLRDYAFVEG